MTKDETEKRYKEAKAKAMEGINFVEINITRGFAEVIENKNNTSVLIHYVRDETGDIIKTCPSATIEIKNGIARLIKKDEGFKFIIIDHDLENKLIENGNIPEDEEYTQYFEEGLKIGWE